MADASALRKLRGMAHGVKAAVFVTALSGECRKVRGPRSYSYFMFLFYFSIKCLIPK